MPGFFSSESEAAVVSGFAQNDDNALVFPPQPVQAAADQFRANAAALKLGKYGNRRQRGCGYRAASGVDPHPGEKDVTDDVGSAFGDV